MNGVREAGNSQKNSPGETGTLTGSWRSCLNTNYDYQYLSCQVRREAKAPLQHCFLQLCSSSHPGPLPTRSRKRGAYRELHSATEGIASATLNLAYAYQSMIRSVQAFPFIHTQFKVGCGSGRWTRGQCRGKVAVG